MKNKIETEHPESGDEIDDQATRVIPVVEEELITGKRTVKKGTVIIEKRIKSEEILVDTPLTSEIINIEHIPKDQIIDFKPATRQEGDTIIIPVVKEVIIKKLLLVEEIRITKEVKTENVTNNITLKKEEIKISRKESQSPSQSPGSDNSHI